MNIKQNNEMTVQDVIEYVKQIKLSAIKAALYPALGAIVVSLGLLMCIAVYELVADYFALSPIHKYAVKSEEGIKRLNWCFEHLDECKTHPEQP